MNDRTIPKLLYSKFEDPLNISILTSRIAFPVSSSGSGAGRCDTDLLKADVAMARNRVGRLKRELHQIKHEVANTEAGMQTLAQ